MKVIIFDLFGTTVCIPKITLKISEENKDSLIRGQNCEISPEITDFFKYQVENARLYEEVPLIDSLLAEPDYLCFCMSNLSQEFTKCFRQLHLDRWQHPIFSCDLGLKKPEESIYTLALEKIKSLLGIEPHEVYMVGDSFVNDYQKPREMGMKSYWLNRNGKKTAINPDHEVSNLLEFYAKIR